MTVSIRVHKHEPAVRFDFLRGAVAWADDIGPKVRREMKRRAPVGRTSPRPGRLRDSIRQSRRVVASAGRVRLEFRAHTPYAGYVVRGTGPHRITARAARALHWMDAAGRDRFATSVHHPGTAPNPFPAEAVEAKRPMIMAAFGKHMTGGL